MSAHKNCKNLLLIITTESNMNAARKLAKAVLKKKLASCISFSEVNSIYWWNNKLEENSEIQLLIKTTLEMQNEALKFIESIHSYDLPEFIFIKASSSSKYVKWIEDTVNLP